MLLRIVVWRAAAGDGDVLRRCVDQVVGQARGRIGRRIAVELEPAGVMMQHDVAHQVGRLRRLEPVVAELATELMRQRGVLVHHDGEARLARRRGLDDHW
jgi:hypothetical protein